MKNNRQLDIGISAGLVLLGALYALFVVDFDSVPFEDAAILMRYAANLAGGHGIVWNVGEAPLDGATDFLFMLILAGLHKLGFSLESGIRMLGIGGHFATGLGIYWFLRTRVQVLPRILSGTTAAYFLLGPGLWLTAAYFGTAFFAASVALSWVLALRLMEGEPKPSLIWGFAFACLLSGLIRPEGVLLSGLMLVSVLWEGNKPTLKVLVPFATVFALIGGSYFLWRWGYFGAPLPNPFYKKGGGHFYPWSLYASIVNTVKMSWPFLILMIWGLFSQNWKGRLVYLIPLTGGVLMWVLLSDEMNFGHRFQYPLLAIACLSWHPFLRFRSEFLAERKMVLVMTLAVMVLVQGWNSRGIRLGKDGRYDLATELNRFASKGYSLATTEAGLLPYYSKWKTLDAWGLNDRHIARQGYLDEAYLSSFAPDLILFHGDLTAYFPLSKSKHTLSWNQMNDTLKHYADSHDYSLAAAYGISPYYVHFYYVNKTNPDHDSLVALIRALPYPWFPDDQLAMDFRQSVLDFPSDP